jgi:hypothetical protein
MGSAGGANPFFFPSGSPAALAIPPGMCYE